MSIGVLIPTEKETEKGRAGKSSTVYKCMMLKCDHLYGMRLFSIETFWWSITIY